MGGDTASVLNSTIYDHHDDDVISNLDIPTQRPGGLSGEIAENESVLVKNYYNTLEFEVNEKRMSRVYQQLIQNYHHHNDRLDNIHVAKTKVLSYTPGSWVENVAGTTMSDYNVPKTTTLLLIGPKGSGKSSLVNSISRVFEDDKFAPERAQVAYNSSMWDGTSFLQEYMIPRNSTSFCFYDTPGFCNVLSENLDMIKQWMTKGVRHGELVKSASDSSSLQARTKGKTHQDKLPTYERRVDFVIFVINGLAVLKFMENSGADTEYMHMVTKVFSSPFLSFKDHKPAIAITHGDLLSISERARVRVYLGDLLGVHPSKQIYDIPDNCEPTTELTIVDLVRYALEHADRNLPCKSQPAISKGSTILLWRRLLLLLVVGISMFSVHLYGFPSPKLHPDPSLKIKKVMEMKKVTELDEEIVPVTSPEIKQATESEEIVPEADMEIKEVAEYDQEIVQEPDLDIRDVAVLAQENVAEPDLELKKARDLDQEVVHKPDLEIKKFVEFDQEIVPEPDLETNKVKKIDPEIVPEHILEMKKVIPEITPKPSKSKKGDAEKTPGKNKKMKKVRVPVRIPVVDWKTIRHIW